MESENDIAPFITSEIKKLEDRKYCTLSMINHGNIKEWIVEYTGPYTGNGVEPAEHCGELFGLRAGAKLILSEKNVLLKTELGTENTYHFDPRSIKINE